MFVISTLVIFASLLWRDFGRMGLFICSLSFAKTLEPCRISLIAFVVVSAPLTYLFRMAFPVLTHVGQFFLTMLRTPPLTPFALILPRGFQVGSTNTRRLLSPKF